MNKRIVDLPNGLPASDDYILSYDSGAATTKKVTLGDYFKSSENISQIVSAVKKSMGYDRVLEKCKYCGHWGAVMCDCPSCGAPIDPVSA